MGIRYEKSKKSVTDNKRESERIEKDNDTLKREFSPLDELMSMQQSLEDEVFSSIRQVETTKFQESARLEEDENNITREKNELAEQIHQEIEKLQIGYDKLQTASDSKFGSSALHQASAEYKKQIQLFENLIGELGDLSHGGRSGQSSEIASAFIQDSSGELSQNNMNPNENNWRDTLKPDRKNPRDLSVTQFGFTKDASGLEVYDSPLEMDKYLYSTQGAAYKNYQGTCGLCSCANILRLSGVNASEKDMIDYATQGGMFSRLCTYVPFRADMSGGTTPKERQQVLDYFGVSSGVWPVKLDSDGSTSTETINDIGKWVSEGRGVIIDVDGGIFYNDLRYNGMGHAVTVTSVAKDKYGGISYFYILDSNRGTVKYPAWQIQEAIRNFVDINVTHQIIR